MGNILEKIQENKHYTIKQDMHHYCMFCNERRLKKLDSMKLHIIKFHSDKIDLQESKNFEIFKSTYSYMNNLEQVLSNKMMLGLINTGSFKSELIKNFISDLMTIGINLDPKQEESNIKQQITDIKKTLKTK